jgi:hypothetical protein
MDVILVLIGINVQMIFFFKREWLFDKKIFIYLLFVNLGIFILSYYLLAFEIGPPIGVELLKLPLPAQLIFWGMDAVYYKFFKAHPQDSFWSMDLSLMKDGIFNFLFIMIGLLVPIYFIYMYKVI